MIKKNIEKICKKNPSWAKIFIQYYNTDKYINLNYISDLLTVISVNKRALHSLGINIQFAQNIITRKDHRYLLEMLDDEINRSLFDYKINKFIESIKTKGYIHLFDDIIENKIKTILRSGISIYAFRKIFIKKIAVFKNDIDGSNLFESLVRFEIKNVCWNKNFYLEKMKSNELDGKVEVLSSDNNTLMILIKDYYSCKIFGPESWCIVQREDVFNSYTRDLKRQVIFFDFNRLTDDPKSIIGFTVDVNGSIHYSYLRDDFATPENIKTKFKFESLDDDILYSYLLSLNEYKSFELIFKYGLFNMSKKFINKDLDCTELLLFSIKKEKFTFVKNFISYFVDNFCPLRLLSEFFPKIHNSNLHELNDLDTQATYYKNSFNPVKAYSSFLVGYDEEDNNLNLNDSIPSEIIDGIIKWIDLFGEHDFIIKTIPSEEWILDDSRFPYKEVQHKLMTLYSK